MIKTNINSKAKNIIVVLFFWLIGVIMGGFYFYAQGTENINSGLIVSSFNNGYMTGHTNNVTLEFKKYIEKINNLLKDLEDK